MQKYELLKILEHIRGERSEEEVKPLLEKLRDEIDRDQRWDEWGDFDKLTSFKK